MEWDDLRFALAVARYGGIAGAARNLKVNHSTVFRHIAGIEARLGVHLFERLSSGYSPTTAGKRLLESAERVEEEILAMQRQIAADTPGSGGTVRVTTTDAIAAHLMLPLIPSFLAQHPSTRLEVIASNDLLDMTRRQADVALRITDAPPEHLVGRKLGKLEYAIYRARTNPAHENDTGRWIGWSESSSLMRSTEWLRQHYPGLTPTIRVSSMPAMLAAASAGAGLAILPIFLGDAEINLTRVGGKLTDLSEELWLLSHSDMRHNPPIQALTRFLSEHLCIPADNDTT